jgi:hypothetical protein
MCIAFFSAENSFQSIIQHTPKLRSVCCEVFVCTQNRWLLILSFKTIFSNKKSPAIFCGAFFGKVSFAD